MELLFDHSGGTFRDLVRSRKTQFEFAVHWENVTRFGSSFRLDSFSLSLIASFYGDIRFSKDLFGMGDAQFLSENGSRRFLKENQSKLCNNLMKFMSVCADNPLAILSL
ncbi:hypothetical protein HNY73_013048 [Argiope bruennichi]|uniref:Uncharacterized protein n=1 Tax=Argiope bruennichi TaxID=94029 RepID=A0A8T0EXI2_ARGBR|nr:hypothetical protein HNY73_013048 [Argiope bruennichi]